MLCALGTALGFLMLWMLRHRPAIGAPLFFLFELVLLLWVGERTSLAGFAFHGEYILHHFVTLLASAAVLSTVARWLFATELGPTRFAPIATAVVGTLGILVGHLLAQPGLLMRAPGWFADVATGTALLTPLLALYPTRKSARRGTYWAAAVALQIPLLLRVLMGLPESLSGGSVPDPLQAPLMATALGTATFVFWAFRPNMPRPVRMTVIALSSLATALLYIIYLRGFSRLEDGLGGLAQSLFGFSLPYPSAVSSWKVILVALCIFFIFSAVYAGLMSWNERVRGLALGLLAITGIGLSNPQLVLMAVAGHLLWLDTLREDAAAHVPPPNPLDEVLAEVASTLDLPNPTALEATKASIVSLRGELHSATLDVRARAETGQRWGILLRMGVVGRNAAPLELIPDGQGNDPALAHPIRDTHRLSGDTRTLERVSDESLDALARFPRCHAKFWTAGVEVDFGSALGEFESPQLCELLVALSENIRNSTPA